MFWLESIFICCVVFFLVVFSLSRFQRCCSSPLWSQFRWTWFWFWSARWPSWPDSAAWATPTRWCECLFSLSRAAADSTRFWLLLSKLSVQVRWSVLWPVRVSVHEKDLFHRWQRSPPRTHHSGSWRWIERHLFWLSSWLVPSSAVFWLFQPTWEDSTATLCGTESEQVSDPSLSDQHRSMCEHQWDRWVLMVKNSLKFNSC